MTNADWKCFLEDLVLDAMQERLFNMSLSDIVKECKWHNIDVEKYFKEVA